MRKLREHDVRWQEGKTWSLAFHAGEQVTQLFKKACKMLFSENA